MSATDDDVADLSQRLEEKAVEVGARDPATTEGEALDECVESVLEDNPDYSEGRAYAICNAQIDEAAVVNATDPVAMKQTPEGVPEGYEYVPPDEEPPDGHDVVQSPRGATYVSPEPTEEGGGGETPADGGDGDDDSARVTLGGEPAATVDLSREVDSRTLEESGITDGSNHADMRIAELEDGGEAFVRDNMEDWQGERAVAGAAVYEQLGVPIPDHHFEDGTLVKEGIEGNTLRDGVEGEVDPDSVVDAYAASIIAGDTDMHGGNMMIRDDGTAVPVDVAGSGSSVSSTDEKRGKIGHYLDTMDIDADFDDVAARAEEMAAELDPDELPNAESGIGETAVENIASNAEAIA